MSGINAGAEFNQVFTPDVKGRLYSAINRAYGTLFEHLPPAECGFNEAMFGYNIYGYCVHELRAEIEAAGLPFELIEYGNTFRFRVGGFEVGCYRAGQDIKDDIWATFPHNELGIQTLTNDPQRWLFPEMEPDGLPKLVLVHLGTLEHRFYGLYLCAARDISERGQVSSWWFADEIWRRAADETSTKAAIVSRAPVPAECVPKPRLSRKPRKEKREGHGSS